MAHYRHRACKCARLFFNLATHVPPLTGTGRPPHFIRAIEANRAEKAAADAARLAEESRRAAAEARSAAEEAAERAQRKAAETRLQRERVKAAARRLREERARAGPRVKVGPCIIC